MKGDIFIAYAILLQSLLAIVQLLLPMYGIMSVEQSSSFRVLTVGITLLPGIVVAARRNIFSLAFPFIFYLVILILHYAIFPASHPFIESKQAITLTPIVILTGVMIYNIRHLEPFKKAFLLVSRASIPLAILYIYGKMHSPFLVEDSLYNMSFGYTMLLPTMFLFTQSNPIDKSCSFILWLLIIFGGSRGPAIVAVAFYLISVLVYSERKKIKLWKWLLFIGFVVLVFVVSLKNLDFESSRTVTLFESGKLISHDSHRSDIHIKAVPHIWESPIVGNGIGSDRYFTGGYCHNFFMEISVHYGILGCFVICVFILTQSLTVYKKKIRTIEDKQLFVLILLAGLMPLMVSSSYLLNANFGLAIGYLYRYKSYKIF